MAVIYMSSFEGQHAGVDGYIQSGLSAPSTAQHRTGAASMRFNPGSSQSAYITNVTTGTYQHFGLYIASLPSVTRIIIGSAAQINVRLTSDGHLEYYSLTTLVGTSSGVLSTGTWYWIGVRHGSGSASDVVVQVDGSTFVTATSNWAGTTTGASFVGAVGTEASAIDFYIDDWITDDAGFLAPSKVDLALPISDNTVTGVTDGNGGTSNLWECINNIPPVGVASANEAANPTANIRFPASTTCQYIFNLETYASLGVGSANELNALQTVIRHGEDINTGTKNGSDTGLISNPAQNNSLTGFIFGTDGGAHAAESGSNFWVTRFGSLITNAGTLAGITIGSSPRQAIQRVSESRVGCVDFAALLVAWTPAAAKSLLVPHRHRGLIVR